MSSEEDEFAAINTTTTPYRVVRVSSDAKPPSKTTTRNVAGPSTKAIAARGRRKRSPSPQEIEEQEADAAAITGSDAEDDSEIVEVQPPPRAARGRRAPPRQRDTSGAARANASARGKGKAKADALDAMDVDEHDADEPEPVHSTAHAKLYRRGMRAGSASAAARTASAAATVMATQRVQDELRRQVERLQKQLDEVTRTRDQFSQQLEEAFHIRNTEPEESAQVNSAQYESRLQTQEEMIQELTSQLARVDSMTKEGKTSTLHFLTREAADEERRGIEAELEKLRAALKAKDEVIGKKDAELRERDDTIRTLRSDLTAEIENTKAIMTRSTVIREPPSVTKNRKAPTGLIDESKNGIVIRLYEDMTNLLVLNVRQVTSAEGVKETEFRCLYTHNASAKCLAFSLRIYKENESGDVEKVNYTALELENEPDQEFIRKLDFLAGSFVFNRDQLHVFLEKIAAHMEMALDETEEDEVG